ncbi:MAG: GerMN domain-containing protein [Desulfobacterales bacterium]|nr:GerMN domain-containing protein [Desulfobacterales bacterium]
MKIKRYGLAALMVFCVVAGGLLAYSYRLFLSTDTKEGPEPMPRKFLPKLAKVRTHLYFLGPDHRFLSAEERNLVQQDGVVERARSIVHALIEGPESDLLPTVPAKTRLLALYVAEDGIAYVDFDKAISDKHPGGSLCEMFTIFSIVNTLALNIPEIEAVKILIEGREAKTLAGHIDIRFPFSPDMLMIK